MPDTPVTAVPFNPVKPKISIGTTGSAVDIACAASDLAVEVEQDETNTETFCGSYTTYKPEVWTITATCYPSYGTAGLWNLLRPLVGGAAKDFTILPDTSVTVSPTNPSMSGKCIVKAFPFYMGSAGEPQSFDVELAVQGTPTFRDGMTFKADWKPLERAARQLSAGIDDGSKRTALTEATRVVQEIRRRVPKRTGRLASTVGVLEERDGAAVTYGGRLPYARYIERRSHAVESATQDAARRFVEAERRMAAGEAKKL